MARFLLVFVAFAAGCMASMVAGEPASAQGLRYFYCYAVDPKTEQIFVSDMHEVGPVSERSSYSEQFANWLKARGMASNSVQAYCVMRTNERDIARGRADLFESKYCPECNGISQFRDVAWLRQGKRVEDLLAGKLIEQPVPKEPTPGLAAPVAAKPSAPVAKPESVIGEGVYVLVRRDMTDVIFAANEKNGASVARQKADLRGGEWGSLVSDSRCPGWMAVAYSSNGSERKYFMAQGAESEGDASRRALAAAEAASKEQEGLSIAGVLVAFRNNFEHPPVDRVDAIVEDGLVKTTQGLIRRELTNNCRDSDWSPASSGIRG